MIVVNERHLPAILSAVVRSDNADRPHQSPGLETPRPVDRPPVGSIRSRPVLGGLHRVHERAA
jgi:hypothetical protein